MTVGELEIQEAFHDGEHVVSLSGELDLASAPAVEATVTRHRASNGTRHAVTLDLSGLQFIDSTGLHALLAAQEFCQTNGFQFSLVPGPARVQRIFEITRLQNAFAWKKPADDPPVEEAASDGAPASSPAAFG